MSWPGNSLGVMDECAESLDSVIRQTDRDLEKIKGRIWAIVGARDAEPRGRILFVLTNSLIEAWPLQRDNYLRWCEAQREGGAAPRPDPPVEHGD